MCIEWREINPDYIISSDGQVGSRRRGNLKMLRPTKANNGYLRVWICANDGMRRRTVHSLVAEAFLPPKPTQEHQVNHKNGIKTDNRDSNLEWMTCAENLKYRFTLGYRAVRGEAHGHAKLTEANVREILARLEAGELQKHLAPIFGISKTMISRIALRKSWAWLK